MEDGEGYMFGMNLQVEGLIKNSSLAWNRVVDI